MRFHCIVILVIPNSCNSIIIVIIFLSRFHLLFFISLGGSGTAAFMSVYADLVEAVKHSVNTLADHCLSTGLISKETYDTIIKRHDFIDVDRARILLSNIQDAISRNAESLDVFIDVLTKVGGFESLVHEIKVCVYLAVLLLMVNF